MRCRTARPHSLEAVARTGAAASSSKCLSLSLSFVATAAGCSVPPSPPKGTSIKHPLGGSSSVALAEAVVRTAEPTLDAAARSPVLLRLSLPLAGSPSLPTTITVPDERRGAEAAARPCRPPRLRQQLQLGGRGGRGGGGGGGRGGEGRSQGARLGVGAVGEVATAQLPCPENGRSCPRTHAVVVAAAAAAFLSVHSLISSSSSDVDSDDSAAGLAVVVDANSATFLHLLVKVVVLVLVLVGVVVGVQHLLAPPALLIARVVDGLPARRAA